MADRARCSWVTDGAGLKSVDLTLVPACHFALHVARVLVNSRDIALPGAGLFDNVTAASVGGFDSQASCGPALMAKLQGVRLARTTCSQGMWVHIHVSPAGFTTISVS